MTLRSNQVVTLTWGMAQAQAGSGIKCCDTYRVIQNRELWRYGMSQENKVLLQTVWCSNRRKSPIINRILRSTTSIIRVLFLCLQNQLFKSGCSIEGSLLPKVGTGMTVVVLRPIMYTRAAKRLIHRSTVSRPSGLYYTTYCIKVTRSRYFNAQHCYSNGGRVLILRWRGNPTNRARKWRLLSLTGRSEAPLDHEWG